MSFGNLNIIIIFLSYFIYQDLKTIVVNRMGYDYNKLQFKIIMLINNVSIRL